MKPLLRRKSGNNGLRGGFDHGMPKSVEGNKPCRAVEGWTLPPIVTINSGRSKCTVAGSDSGSSDLTETFQRGDDSAPALQSFQSTMVRDLSVAGETRPWSSTLGFETLPFSVKKVDDIMVVKLGRRCGARCLRPWSSFRYWSHCGVRRLCQQFLASRLFSQETGLLPVKNTEMAAIARRSSANDDCVVVLSFAFVKRGIFIN